MQENRVDWPREEVLRQSYSQIRGIYLASRIGFDDSSDFSGLNGGLRSKDLKTTISSSDQEG